MEAKHQEPVAPTARTYIPFTIAGTTYAVRSHEVRRPLSAQGRR